MDAVFGANAALIPWFLAALTAAVMLLAMLAAWAVAERARAAAHDAERAASSLTDLHRQAERLYAAWREETTALSRFRSELPLPYPPFPRSPLIATKLEDESLGAAPEAPVTKAMDQSAGTESAGESTVIGSGGDLAPAQPTDEFHGMVVLRVRHGTEPGREYKLPFEACTIGRAGSNRVMLAENRASRVHANLRYEHNQFFIKDKASTNGTRRNGVVVTNDMLKFGDVLTIGNTDLLFTCEGFDLKDSDPRRAIAAFERLLEREPNFVPGLQILAFLFERDVARRRDAERVWRQLRRLET